MVAILPDDSRGAGTSLVTRVKGRLSALHGPRRKHGAMVDHPWIPSGNPGPFSHGVGSE